MEKESEILKIGECYESKPDGTLIYKEPILSKDTREVVGVEETAIANHTPILKEQRIVDNGIEQVEELVFEVRRAGRTWGAIPVTLKDVLSQTPNIKFGAACRIFIGRGTKGRYSEAMQIQCENALQTTVYQHTGYSFADGERVFLNGGYSVTANGLTDKYSVQMDGKLGRYGFSNEKHLSRYNTLLVDLPKVAPKSLIYTALAYSFLTPLNAMLQGIGYEPRFILYFIGKTGSRKSTLANLFLSFFGTFRETESAPISFKDTSNAAEMSMAVLNSTLTLLDDRIPSTTKSVKDQMERMEQSVARAIGDRAGRGRMNPNGTLKKVYRPVCNLIITAEEAYSNVGESAIARSVSCELKPGDVDLSALTVVQQKANELNECMAEYIQYVLANWDTIAEKIKPMFLSLRDKAQTGGHGRLAVAVAHLQIGMTIMCDWLKSVNAIAEEQSKQIEEQAWEIFIALSAEQNRRIYEEKPVKLFLNAVKELMDRGEIRFSDLNEEYNPIKPIGYEDEYFYYCYPDSIYSEVRKFYAAQDLNFPLGKTALFQQLAIDKLIETDKNQNTKAKRISDKNGTKRPRLLWLRKEALENKEENE